MLLAVLWTFFDSLATNLWKKSLWFWAPKELFNLISRSSLIFVTTVLYIFSDISFSWVNLYIILWAIFITIWWTYNVLLRQYIYSKEKISVLTPYTNVNKMLSIVFGFFIFSDVSLISLFITISAIFIIIAFSIDIKNIKISKNILLLLISEIITAIMAIITGYILLTIAWSAFFIITYIIWIMHMWSICFMKQQFAELKKLPKKFYKYRLAACHCWGIGYLISVLVIKELGLSVAILLSFLWIWMTLVISRIIFKDIPQKKDLLLTIIVTALVGIWYYFK